LHALVGLRQRQRHKALAQRLLEDHVEQRQDAFGQSLLAQLAHAGARMPGHEQLQHFVVQARRRHVLEQRREAPDRRLGGGFDGEAKLRRQPHGAQHAHRVFAKARLRVADHAQQVLLQVGHAAVVVDDLLARRVEIQGIDGEVAPARILLLVAEHVVAQHAAVLVLLGGVGVGGAEGGGLHRFPPEHHVHQAEAPADDDGAPEQGLHLFGARVGGDVEVLRRDAEQQVAHRAAHHVGGVARIAQHVAHL